MSSQNPTTPAPDMLATRTSQSMRKKSNASDNNKEQVVAQEKQN